MTSLTKTERRAHETSSMAEILFQRAPPLLVAWLLCPCAKDGTGSPS